MYFQRVLSSKSPEAAQILSLVGGVGCFIMAIPSVLLGAAARVTGTLHNYTSVHIRESYESV